MERNKMEQDIKKKLDARSITPTPMAWDRLDAMLSIAEKKEIEKKPLVMWLSIAACFIALLFAGIFFLNQESDNVKNGIDNGNTVVSAPEKKADTNTSVITEEIINEEVTPAAEAPVAVIAKKSVNKLPHKMTTIKSQPTPGVPQVEAPKEEVAVNTPEIENPASIRSSKIKVDASALLASVDKPSLNNTPKKSAVEVTSGPAKKTIDVNANTLLTSVEGELEQSFRGKVINSIQKNYNTVKTAVATRNRQ